MKPTVLRLPLYAGLLCILVLTPLLPATAHALPLEQEPDPIPDPIYVPVVTNGVAESMPAGEFEQDAEVAEARLLSEARAALPEPATLAGTPGPDLPPLPPPDKDGDGVPDDKDSCPHQPNPPVNGQQPARCGDALTEQIDGFVWLKSRIFAPPAGLDPALGDTQVRPRVHVLLHVVPRPNGVVLPQAARDQLAERGVTLLGYLPHNTFYASVPRDRAFLQSLAERPFVHGISALRPRDKVAPDLRATGPIYGRNEDGTVTVLVDFYADASATEIEETLNRLEISHALDYDQTYTLTLKAWSQLHRLVVQDIVSWVSDMPAPNVNRTGNIDGLIDAHRVETVLGYEGNGFVVSMTEMGHAGPQTHPDMYGRITEGNAPVAFVASEVDHAQKVAAILIADGTSFPQQAGLLPDAELITYSSNGIITLKRLHYGIPTEAREDYGALLNNNSWGPISCPKRGDYTRRGKFFDRAARETGISIVYAAGNARGPDGDFVTDTLFPCEADLFSLPHPVAKNDISVGNWNIGQSAIDGTSSAGPSADGRLKPDLVAPGQGVNTIGYDPASSTTYSTSFGGTSAAAPVVSGVLGWLGESFEQNGTPANSVDPARYKAILVHTADDVGPPGPDYLHGYGLIQADAALRISESWTEWGREGTLDNGTPTLSYSILVNSPMAFYKATLAWDDEEGEHTATLALKNDLDLTLTSPSGTVYRPFDTVLPAGAVIDDGSEPCTNPACQDRRNNVEQVLVQPGSGLIEEGIWRATVSAHRLVSSEQDFSLVLTPPCPLVLAGTFTLTKDLSCGYDPMAPEAVVVEGDSVILDCANHAVIGESATAGAFSGAYTGIHVGGNNATVQNCTVQRFDVGIAVGDDRTQPSNVLVQSNTLAETGSRAISAVGSGHVLRDNGISLMASIDGVGTHVQGDNIDVEGNGYSSAMQSGGSGRTTAVLVTDGSAGGRVGDNFIQGNWWRGIHLTGSDGAADVSGYSVDANTFEGIAESAIRLDGAVHTNDVTGNTITVWGETDPAIAVVDRVVETASLRPGGNTVGSNDISGLARQTGVLVARADDTVVVANQIEFVGVGIDDMESKSSSISVNQIENDRTGSPPPGAVGIRLSGSADSSLVANTIDLGGAGIEVLGGTNPSLQRNTLTTSEAAITVDGVQAALLFDNIINSDATGIVWRDNSAGSVQGNGITSDGIGLDWDNSPGGSATDNSITTSATALAWTDSPGGTISGNGIVKPPLVAPGGTGIAVDASDGIAVSANGVSGRDVGISVSNSLSATVSSNAVEDPGAAGLLLDAASGALVEQNEITDNGAVGIVYAAGTNAVIQANEVTSLSGGEGIQLGDGEVAVCAVDVDHLLVQDNVLTGGAAGITTRCDVGKNVTLLNN